MPPSPSASYRPPPNSLALVATLGQRADDARTRRFGTPSVLLERASDVLPDEFRARNPARAGSSGQQPMVRRSERNRDGLLPGQGHGNAVPQRKLLPRMVTSWLGGQVSAGRVRLHHLERRSPAAACPRLSRRHADREVGFGQPESDEGRGDAAHSGADPRAGS